MREVREACASLPVVDSLEKGRKPPTLLTRAIGSKKLWCPPTMRRLAVGRRRESVHKLLRVAGFAALAAIMLALLAQGGVASSAGAAPYVVVLKQGVDSRAVANLHAQRYGVDVGFVYGHALKGYSAVVAEARVDDLRADANVAFLSPDGEVSATAQTLPTGVDRIEGDQSSTVSGNGSGSVNVPVAVIDTGIDLDHPDLNVVGGVNCSSGPSFDDGNGHGTHVAGTIGAKDDGVGIVGMAPGTPLYAVRVLNNAGSGSFASVICGVDWVTANAASLGIKVANMSLGGSGSDGSCASDAFHLAICNSVAAGVTYVVAAGNSGGDFSGLVPATFGEVLTVDRRRRLQRPAGRRCRCHLPERPGRHGRRLQQLHDHHVDRRRAHDRRPGRLHPLDLEAGRLQHHLGHEHGDAARRRHGCALHRRAVRRNEPVAGDCQAPRRRRFAACKLRVPRRPKQPDHDRRAETQDALLRVSRLRRRLLATSSPSPTERGRRRERRPRSLWLPSR
jgi:subtilisin